MHAGPQAHSVSLAPVPYVRVLGGILTFLSSFPDPHPKLPLAQEFPSPQLIILIALPLQIYFLSWRFSLSSPSLALPTLHFSALLMLLSQSYSVSFCFRLFQMLLAILPLISTIKTFPLNHTNETVMSLVYTVATYTSKAIKPSSYLKKRK